MAHNPQAPQNPPGPPIDPAGSTQMFRAFVDEGGPQQAPASRAAQSSGPRLGVILGAVAAVVVVAVVVWLALG